MNLILRKTLRFLFILQEVDNRNKTPKMGRGFFTAYRLNPFNPLSYIFIIIILIFGIIMFGIIGFWKEIDYRNPFAWN
jgi:hypothetical protein